MIFKEFICLQKLDPADFNTCVFDDPATAQMLFGRNLAVFAEVLREWEGCEKYAERFDAYKESYLSHIQKSYTLNKSEFGYNVLNHADFHINNMLFKKNNDKIEEVLFVSLEVYFLLLIVHEPFFILI